MFTYFIQGPPLSPVKIGRARDVASRMASLQTGTPHELRALLVLKGDREEEMHWRFRKHRIRGEWFQWCDEIRDFLRKHYSDRPKVWSMVNAYCTEEERREFNEWRGRATVAAIEARDWARLVATATGREVPKEFNDLVDAVSDVPSLYT